MLVSHHVSRLPSHPWRRCAAHSALGALALLVCAASRAQNAPAGADQTTTAAAGGNQLQEVIVTAQFQRQTAQSTPLAITAISAASLAERGQTSLTQISQDVPSVALNTENPAFGPSMGAYIRGIGQLDLDPALEPGVGIYVDDVYMGTLTGSLLDLLDLDRVEVLRGPQGTLEGMNSEGGAVKLFSKPPDSTESMSFDVLYGSRNHVELRASTNFALAKDLYVRLSGVGNHQDGYENVYDFGCANPTLTATPLLSPLPVPTYGTPGTYSVSVGPTRKVNSCVIGHQGGTGYAAGRVYLRWVPSDSLDVNLIGDLTNQDQENPAETLIYAGPGPLEGNASATEGALITIPATNVATGAPAQLPYDVTKVPAIVPSNPYTSYANSCMPASPAPFPASAICASPRQTMKSWGVDLTVDWTVNSALSVKNILAQRGYSSTWSEDNDQSIWPVGLGIEGMGHHQLSEELRFTGHWGSLLDYTFGGYYFRELTVYPAHEDLWYVVPFVPGLFNFLQDDPVLAHDKAGYLHLVYHLTPKFDVTVGTRFTSQDKTYHYVRLNPEGTTGGSAAIVSPLNGVAATYNANRWDWRADLSYRFTPQVMVYGQYSTGFKGGGVDPRPFYVQQAVQFNPETLSTYELGLKSTWFQDHLMANLDGYFSQYRDVQLVLGLCGGVAGIPVAFGAPCALPYNAGSAHQKGVEFETRMRFGGFEADANMSYLDFKYVSLNPATGVTLDMVTPWTPKWQAGGGVQYTVSTPAGALTARVDANTRSQVYTAAVNGPYNHIGGYSFFNAHLTWDPPKGNWEVSLQALNFTEKRYWVNVFDLAMLGGASVGGVPSAPMELDLEVKHSMHY
jgi:iron complex outermembrane recepter protein